MRARSCAADRIRCGTELFIGPNKHTPENEPDTFGLATHTHTRARTHVHHELHPIEQYVYAGRIQSHLSISVRARVCVYEWIN